MRRLTYAVLVVLLAVALAGCVGVPDSGPVVTTKDQGNPVSDPGAQFIDPLPPQPGQSPTEIVRGFINAMQAWPSQTATAKQFLTTDAAQAWDPQQETITYDATPTPEDKAGDVVVSLDGADHLDERGAWQGQLTRGHRTLTFSMALDDDEWRIDKAPNALIVPQTWFSERYRQVSVYYFDPTASILEPEPVFVPRGEQLASTLVHALLLGPGPGLEHVAQTFIPTGLEVAVGVTVSDDGVADVLLTGDAGQLSPNTVELMAAQFAWTLRQEPEVHSVRISIGGEPVPLPGGAGSFRVDIGAGYDPAGFQASPLLYGLRGGRVVAGNADAFDPVKGPLGSTAYDLRSVGVDLVGEHAAGVRSSGESVLLGPLSDDGRQQVREVAVGRNFLRPAWDFEDRMWLVDRTSNGAKVLYADHGGSGPLTELRVRGVTGEQVRAFLVSRDGTRLIAVVRHGDSDDLVVSRIEHTVTGRVSGAVPAERIDVGDVDLPIHDLTWRSTTSLDVLNPLASTLFQVAPASIDGAPVSADSTATVVDDRVLSLAGSPVPDQRIYGVTRTGLVDVLSSDHRTTPFDKPVTAVVYAG